jgi:hypothetical protein
MAIAFQIRHPANLIGQISSASIMEPALLEFDNERLPCSP